MQEGGWLFSKFLTWSHRNKAKLREAAEGVTQGKVEQGVLSDFDSIPDFLIYVCQGFTEALCAVVTLHVIFALECFLFWKTDFHFA